MIFTESKDDGGHVALSVPKNAALDEVFESFTDFLRASGYVIPYDEHIGLIIND